MALSDYENASPASCTDGLGTFGPKQVIGGTGGSVREADLDGDGDYDVLSASGNDDKIAWYENQGPPDLTVTCTPLEDVIVIPPTGGIYAYGIEIVNNSTRPETFDIWLDIDGPTSADHSEGPFTTTFPSGRSHLMRVLNQRIPAEAPVGDYTHTCNVGTFPSADASNSFDFTKTTEFAPGGVSVANWSTEAEIAAALSGREFTAEVPSSYLLERSYPNPFNPSTTIGFGLPESAAVRLVVYDVLGRQISVLLDGVREAGMHEVVFDASDLPSGTYLYKLETPQGSMVRTMLLAK